MVAIRALEARSVEFVREKEEKRKLEERICMLQGQVIRGDRGDRGGGGVMGQGMEMGQGQQGGDSLSPGVEMSTGMGGLGLGLTHLQGADLDLLVREEREKLSMEYGFKLADLEREREGVEEEKAQVDRYETLCVCVCMCVYVCVCMMYVSVWVYVCMYVCVYVCMYVFMCVCMCVYVCTCLYMYV
jgi:hypothetical protein